MWPCILSEITDVSAIKEKLFPYGLQAFVHVGIMLKHDNVIYSYVYILQIKNN